MAPYLKQLLPLAYLFYASFWVAAQDTSSTFQRHHNFYISVGAGSSTLNEFPSDIYFDGSTNLQLGAMYERAFHKRFSLVVGLEFEQVSYNFDGDLEFISNSELKLIEAGQDKKYTGIRQRSLALPIQIRTYFWENYNADTKNMFLQGGVRVVQSLDFIGSNPLRTTYYYRSEGKNEEIELSDYTNQTLLQAELMIGFKGQFFKRIDLLNASTLGVMYQFNPMFKGNSTEIYPMHFTWRFLF